MVNSVTHSSSASNSTALGSPSSAASSATLAKDDFLMLLVAQLQNQDPLSPSDPTEFTAQLAQFSSLEQLTSVNENLAQMIQDSNNSQELEQLSAFSLIGRQVEMQGPTFEYSGSPVGFGYTLDKNASAVSVHIVDANDQVVAVLPEASALAGSHDYVWDGTTLNGEQAAAGEYHVVIERTDAGVSSSVDSRIFGLVDGVDLGPNGTVLTTSVGDVGMADVLRVTGA